MYANVIRERKLIEIGEDPTKASNVDMLELLDLIETVKAEKRNG